MNRRRNTGSFLVPGMEDVAAQAKARKALATSWLTMRVIVRYPDADEPPEPLEQTDSGFMAKLELSFNLFDELPNASDRCLGWACPFPLSVCECCVAAKERNAGGEDDS